MSSDDEAQRKREENIKDIAKRFPGRFTSIDSKAREIRARDDPSVELTTYQKSRREDEIVRLAGQTGYRGQLGEKARQIEARQASYTDPYKYRQTAQTQALQYQAQQRQGVQYPEVVEHAPLEIAVQERRKLQLSSLYQRSALSDLSQAGLITLKEGKIYLTEKGKSSVFIQPAKGKGYWVSGEEKMYSLEENAVWGKSFDFILGEGDELKMYPHGTREALKASGKSTPEFVVDDAGDIYFLLGKEGETAQVRQVDTSSFKLRDATSQPYENFVEKQAKVNPYAGFLQKAKEQDQANEDFKEKLRQENQNKAMKVIDNLNNPKYEGYAGYVSKLDKEIERNTILADLGTVAATGKKAIYDAAPGLKENPVSAFVVSFGAGGVNSLAGFPEFTAKAGVRVFGVVPYTLGGKSTERIKDIGGFYVKSGTKMGTQAIIGIGKGIEQVASGDITPVAAKAGEITGGAFALSAAFGGLKPGSTKAISTGKKASIVGNVQKAEAVKRSSAIQGMLGKARMSKPATFSEKVSLAKTAVDKWITTKKIEVGLGKLKPAQPKPQVIASKGGIFENTKVIAIPKEAGKQFGKPIYQKQLMVTVTRSRAPVAGGSTATAGIIGSMNTVIKPKMTPAAAKEIEKKAVLKREMLREEIEQEYILTPRTIQPIKEAGLLRQFVNQGLRTPQRVRTSPVERVGEMPRYGARTIVRTVPFVGQKVTPRPKIVQKQKFKFKEPTMPKYPSIPLAKFKKPEEGKKKRSKKEKKKLETEYKPSLFGLDFKVRKKKSQKYYTGAEVRGV